MPAQILIYAAFGAFIAYFSSDPDYTHLPPEVAVITLSFSHAGERATPCRKLSAEEIARLAANMRRAEQCPRGRVDVVVELDLDGETLYRASLAPAGLARDGASTALERFVVSAGRHSLRARLRDSRRADGFDYELEETVELEPGRNVVLDFRADTGGFTLL
ncbi:MAG: hypothetical protein R3286_09670 [Gammaproteobacteria bacterium]|nr:hypothetical protein [Gammaproteobacteria bacterium]